MNDSQPSETQMVARFQRRVEERHANAELARAKHLADWAVLRRAVVEELVRQGQTPVVQLRRFQVGRIRNCIPKEHAWWPRRSVEDNERELRLADERRDVRPAHIHGGAPECNATLSTARLVDRAEREGADAALAMLVLALMHYRHTRGGQQLATAELSDRAREAMRGVHPILHDLDWSPGSKDVLPFMLPQAAKATNLQEIGEILGKDAALLMADWVPVCIQERVAHPA